MTLEQLKNEAYGLGLTDSDVAEYGNVRAKACWQAAIAAQKQLNAEATEENRQARVAHAYKSPSAPMVVPVAFGAAVGTALFRNIGGMLSRK